MRKYQKLPTRYVTLGVAYRICAGCGNMSVSIDEWSHKIFNLTSIHGGGDVLNQLLFLIVAAHCE